MKEGILMALKSLKNNFNNIIAFTQGQMIQPIPYINTFIVTDLLAAINGKKVLEIQSSQTGTTQNVSLQDVYIDTNPTNGFSTYELILKNTFDGKTVLVINVSNVGRHNTDLYRHYLYDIEKPNQVAYRLQFK